MWKCPKCGREFKNTKQDHFCVEPNRIDEYITAQSKDIRPLLQSIRETNHVAAPEATKNIMADADISAVIQKHIGLTPALTMTSSPTSYDGG